ncbi:ATP-binding protein [Archangium violaceum]|uniref:ATP-binding protein n=1 Tax=Archangium violaceum TaxID=83451 RepID=UPI0005BE43D8|nr:serine/threonine-protein kinase [Archangium violaceum]
MTIQASSLRALIPERIGPYRILGVLGRGGMGVVYRSQHVDTGELTAVKTVATAGEGTVASIRREIHALQQLRHPGVVRIVEQGVHGGLPWYAMELLQGRTLRHHLTEFWREETTRDGATETISGSGVRTATSATPNGPLLTPSSPGIVSSPAVPTRRTTPRAVSASALAPLLTMVRRLCTTLAYLHGKGIIHRDLKPENIFIRADGMPSLVDFGVSSQFGGAKGREILEVGGWVMGSISYMAPEQLRGQLVDARADLYALGAILYECVTGQTPFAGTRSHHVLQQILFESPQPPSQRVEGVPPQLEELILKLLEKSSRQRLGHADDVALALSELGAEGWSAEAPQAQPYLYRPAFSGRTDIIEKLRGALRRAAGKQGGCVFIGGESGVGKTRTAMEAATEATRQGFQVVTGECVAVGVADSKGDAIKAGPLHPFRPMLLAVADRCQQQGAAETERLLGLNGKLLAPYEPSLAELPGLSAQPEPAALPAQAARNRLFETLRGTLFAFSESKPVLLIIDDLQWADELSLGFLHWMLANSMEGSRLLIMGTYRLEEMSEPLRALVRSPSALGVELGRLEASIVRAIVSDMLALRTPPQVLVDFLDRQSGGNPFFIAEYLRAAIARGVLHRTQVGMWHFAQQDASGPLEQSLPLPRTLAELIEARLLLLSPTSRTLVQLASVLGREFDGSLLTTAAVVGDTEEMDAIEELRTRQILEDAGDGHFRFVHDKLREIAYENIEASRRRSLHHAAAEAIETRYTHSPSAARFYPSLAHHWSKAEIRDKAVHYLVRAGEHAKRTFANEEAIGFYRSAIGLLDELLRLKTAREETWRDSLGVVHENLADVLSLSGRQEDARRAYADTFALLPPSERVRRANLHRKIGKTWETHHKHEEALRAHQEAEAALGPEVAGADEAWWRAWVQIRLDQIWVYYWLARVPEMSKLAESVRPVIEAHGTPMQRAKFFQALVYTSFRRDRYQVPDETVRYARSARDAASASGDLGELALMQFGLAASLLFHESLDEAAHEMNEAVRLAKRVGDVALLSRALTYLAIVHRRRRGHASEVQRCAEESLSVALAGNMVEYIGTARANQAWLAWLRKDLAEVVEKGRAAQGFWGQISLVYPFQWSALFPLLAVALPAGRLSEAVEHARALVKPTQQRLPASLEFVLQESVAEWERGQEEAARASLSRAVALAEEFGYL